MFYISRLQPNQILIILLRVANLIPYRQVQLTFNGKRYPRLSFLKQQRTHRQKNRKQETAIHFLRVNLFENGITL